MAALAANKNALRNELRTWRSSRSEAEVDEASVAITRALRALPEWSKAGGVAAFFGTRGEPNTRELLDAVLDSGRELWLPRITKRELQGVGVMPMGRSVTVRRGALFFAGAASNVESHVADEKRDGDRQ